MSFEKLVRVLLRLIIASSVLWSSFCLISSGFASLVVSHDPRHGDHDPRHGDNTGVGILCVSIPLAALCAIAILAAIEKWLIHRDAGADNKAS